MKLAFVYAGQGSQHAGMGADLYEAYPAFREVFDRANAGFDLKNLCFNGPEEQLSQTRFTQPCMVAFAVGVTKLLYAEEIRPCMAAGLSLGEYSALYAAGVLDEETVVPLAAYRGKVMEEAVGELPCGMVAVLGLGREPLQEACEEAAPLGLCEIANYNCPGQLVIAGEAAAVEKASALALEKGAKRCIPLKVSGPFHTSLMAPAGQALAERFPSVSFSQPQFPVLFNAVGRPLQGEETIPDMLVRQVQSSVRFEDTIRYMESQGVDTILEIGPGKALSGFVRKTAKGIRTLLAEDVPSLQAAMAQLKESHCD